jgi:hypothetical protein
MQRFRAEPVDWPQLLRELSAKGVTRMVLAEVCDRSDRTVGDWKNRGSTPRYEDGATILALHRRSCAPKDPPRK